MTSATATSVFLVENVAPWSQMASTTRNNPNANESPPAVIACHGYIVQPLENTDTKMGTWETRAYRSNHKKHRPNKSIIAPHTICPKSRLVVGIYVMGPNKKKMSYRE